MPIIGFSYNNVKLDLNKNWDGSNMGEIIIIN